MIKLAKQIVSENRGLLKISGDSREEVLGELYKYINFGQSICIRNGATIEDDTGISWLNILESEGYATIDINEFIKTLQAIELHKLSQKTQHEKHISDKMRDKAKFLGQKMWENIEETNIFKDSAETEYVLTVD